MSAVCDFTFYSTMQSHQCAFVFVFVGRLISFCLIWFDLVSSRPVTSLSFDVVYYFSFFNKMSLMLSGGTVCTHTSHLQLSISKGYLNKNVCLFVALLIVAVAVAAAVTVVVAVRFD